MAPPRGKLSPAGRKFLDLDLETVSDPSGQTTDPVITPQGQASDVEAIATAASVSADDGVPIEDVLPQAWENLGPSALRFWNDIKQIVTNPVGTVESVSDLGEGLYYLLTGERDKPEAELAREVGNFFKERYFGWENLKKTIATDPVGFFADVSTLATGGGMLAAKIPLAAAKGTGRAMTTIGRFTDPITAPIAALNATGLPRGIAGVTTGAGGAALNIASKASRRGGEYAQTFLAHLRGNAPVSDLVDIAKNAAGELRTVRRIKYLEKLEELKMDKTILDLSKIDDAITAAQSEGKYAGISIRTEKPAKVLKDITDKLDEFKLGDPGTYRTPAALDALKQHVWEIREPLEWGSAERRIAESIYHTIRKEITAQVPFYADMMGDYEKLSQKIYDLEKTLRLEPGKKRAIDSQVRTLSSAMRNNVQTGWGQRVKLIDQLAATDAGKNLPAAIAGQSLSPWTPRGIVRGGALPALAMAVQQPLAAAAVLPAAIPRLMGETAYQGGRAIRGAPYVTNPAYQAGRLNDDVEQRRRADALARALHGRGD
jgi:hypothetical protein